MQVTTSIDLSAVITSITALMVVVFGYFTRKDAKKKDEKVQEIQHMLNGEGTAQRKKLLAVLKSQRAMMVGLKLNDADELQVVFLDEEIATLEKEIAERIAAATARAVKAGTTS